MPTPRKDFNDIKSSMGKKSAVEFVKASGRSSALNKAKTRKPVDRVKQAMSELKHRNYKWGGRV